MFMRIYTEETSEMTFHNRGKMRTVSPGARSRARERGMTARVAGPKPEQADEKYRVKVLDNFAAILDLFTESENALTLDEIARKSGLAKTTAFRILKGLERHAIFKYREIGQTYSLGMRVLELGGIVYNSLSLRKIAAPFLDELSRELKAMLLLGIMQGDRVQYIDKRESDSIIRSSYYAGLKKPPHYGMLGTVLMAYMEDDERQRLLKLYPPVKLTDKTTTATRDILRKTEQTRKQGYYVERGEVIEGVVGIAVPLADFSGKVVAALGACLLEFQVKPDALEHVVRKVVEAGRSISRELGSG